MDYKYQKTTFVLLSFMLMFGESVFAKEADEGGTKVTVEQLDTEVQALQAADEALHMKIDNIDRTAELCALYQQLHDNSLLGNLAVPDYCPEPPVFCPQDVKQCPDGSYVGRDPNNNCEFFDCPQEPVFCPQDVKQCPDGSYVGRDPNNNCEFFACPEEPIFCGGIAGLTCPGDLVCIDNPADNCDPLMGGADCGGICVAP